MKGVRLKGPVFETPNDAIYFRQIFGDENRYRQIITNFLTNAIKFTPRNGIVSILLKIIDAKPILPAPEAAEDEGLSDLASQRSGAAIAEKEEQEKLYNSMRFLEQVINFEMTIRDSGCGISEENQKKLFSNFSKLEEGAEMNK